jgi:hypothetical protein
VCRCCRSSGPSVRSRPSEGFRTSWRPG